MTTRPIPNPIYLAAIMPGQRHPGVYAIPARIDEELGTIVLSDGDVALVRDDDVRFVTPKVPLPHADTHEALGSDPITIELSQVSDAGTAAAADTGDFEAAGAIAAHIADADPHTQYQRESEKNAANGYMGADANGRLALASIAHITTDRILGRDTAGTGAVEEIIVAGGLEFNGSGRIQTSAFTGDVTKSAGGTALTIANDAVTLAKMANLATDRIIGRDTTGTGDPEALTVGGGIEFTGSGGIQSSAHTGDVTKSAGGTVTTIAADAVTVAKLSAFQRVFGHRGARRFYEINARLGATSRWPTGVGVAPAVTGAGTSALSAEGVLQTFTTAASVNAIAGGLLTDSEGNFLRSNAPRCLFRIKASSSTTDLRIFVGMTDTALGAADDPAAVAALFRYSTSASDPGWVCVTRSGSLTVSGSVRTYTADEVLLMGIDFEDTGTARFWMGTSEADIAVVHTTTSSLFNIASTVRLMVGVGAVAASARAISFDRATVIF